MICFLENSLPQQVSSEYSLNLLCSNFPPKLLNLLWVSINFFLWHRFKRIWWMVRLISNILKLIIAKPLFHDKTLLGLKNWIVSFHWRWVLWFPTLLLFLIRSLKPLFSATSYLFLIFIFIIFLFSSFSFLWYSESWCFINVM